MTSTTEIRVMASGAMKEAYLAIQPAFERSSGFRVVTAWLPTVQILSRLRNGESVDLLVLAASTIDDLIGDGTIAGGGRIDLAQCGIGVAVRAGAHRPAIASPEAFRQTLLAAQSIAYSTGPSGVHLLDLIAQLGIAEALQSKLIRANAEPTGALVARGEAQLGFQQVCELLPVHGIDFLGPLPEPLQKYTTFSAGVHVNAAQPEAARALAAFIAAPAAQPVLRQKGMIPC